MKIELDIDPSVVKQAQEIAQRQNRRLDELVEAYLRNIVMYQQFEVSSEVKDLPKGLVNPEDKEYTEKDARYDYLAEKHLR
jgi:hypothetical protein